MLTKNNLKFHFCPYLSALARNFCSDLMSAHHHEMNGSPGARSLDGAVMHHGKASGRSMVPDLSCLQTCSQTIKNLKQH